jgi:hypothetical protein
MNANLPPLQVWVRNKYIISNRKSGYTYAHLISARSLQNQAIQFSILTDDGALITGLPIHAITFKKGANELTLQQALMWDNISSSIQVIAFDTLRYMACTVKRTDNVLVPGEYLFTIDYVGNDDLSRNSEHWKMTHAVKGSDGNLYIYPQYRIQFKDKGLCFNSNGKLRRYKYNQIIWTTGN